MKRIRKFTLILSIVSMISITSGCGNSSLAEHRSRVLQADLNDIAGPLQEFIATSKYSNDLILNNSPTFEVELPEIIQKSIDSLDKIGRVLNRFETDLNLYEDSLPKNSSPKSLGSKDSRKLLDAFKQWRYYQDLILDIAKSCLDSGEYVVTCMGKKAVDILYYDTKSREKVDKLGDLFRKFGIID